jgi:hypothetical protein
MLKCFALAVGERIASEDFHAVTTERRRQAEDHIVQAVFTLNQRAYWVDGAI